MTLGITPEQQKLLDHWLPLNPSGARGLLRESWFPELGQDGLEKLLAEVRAIRDRYAGSPSVLIAPVAVDGDGAPARTSSGLSVWERIWLIIDREPDLPAAFAALRERFSFSEVLDVFGAFVLASESLEIACRRVQFAAGLPAETWIERGDDRSPWVCWLDGGSLPATSATSGDHAVVAALQGDWLRYAEFVPPKLRRNYPKAIRIGPQNLMHAQLLRQLWSHHRTKKPDATVLRQSLTNLFSHWGRETRNSWHDGMGVGSRLPLLGMVARILKIEPIVLLYELRALNPHLVTPPARTFTLPANVDAAYEAFETMVADALARGGTFRRDGGYDTPLVLRSLA